MTEKQAQRNPLVFNFRGNLIAGLLAITPLMVVWLVFNFLLDLLFQAGQPLAQALATAIDGWIPAFQPVLANATVQWLIAVFVALFVLYVIGAITSRVLGKRLMALFERIIARIPLVESIYSATKKLVGALQRQPEGASRVVLVAFPHPGLRAVGLVMRTFRDSVTGEELAAVFVPTAPNPTSGYLQIVKTKDLTATDMSIDQAMTMIISGGATAPDHMTLQPEIK